jgi:hypothetical protein
MLPLKGVGMWGDPRISLKQGHSEKVGIVVLEHEHDDNSPYTDNNSPYTDDDNSPYTDDNSPYTDDNYPHTDDNNIY